MIETLEAPTSSLIINRFFRFVDKCMRIQRSMNSEIEFSVAKTPFSTYAFLVRSKVNQTLTTWQTDPSKGEVLCVPPTCIQPTSDTVSTDRIRLVTTSHRASVLKNGRHAGLMHAGQHGRAHLHSEGLLQKWHRAHPGKNLFLAVHPRR